jgi:DNA-binding MarR family transcriptional regulator
MAATPRDAVDRLMHLSALMDADLSRYEQESGLTRARIHLLWQLGVDGPRTQQSLAAVLEVTPRNVTGLVDGLVASGHVTREPHPTDRRATLVTPTDLGSRVIRENQEGYAEMAERLFGDLSARRLTDLVSVLDGTIERFAVMLDEVRGVES